MTHVFPELFADSEATYQAKLHTFSQISAGHDFGNRSFVTTDSQILGIGESQFSFCCNSGQRFARNEGRKLRANPPLCTNPCPL